MKVILTGSNGGLGTELVNIFQKNNWEVVGISRNKNENQQYDHIEADLTKEDDIEKVAKTIKDSHPDFNAIINCAAKLNIEKLDKIDYKNTESLIKLNLIAPMMLVSRLKKEILKNEADIVNIGSTIGFKAYEEQAAYGSSKWGLRGFNENLRIEFKGTKVRVISFNPGGFKSQIFEKATGIKPNLSAYMEPKQLAETIFFILNLPKTMEVSEIVINRK